MNQNNSSASLHIWVSRAASLSSGDRHPPRGGGQRWGPVGTAGSSLEKVLLLSSLREGVQGWGVVCAGHSPMLEGHGRVSAREEGTYRLAHRVTRPGSRLQSSVHRASSPGPGAEPRSGGWQSRGRRHRGCSGTPRSPRRSAHSQLLQGPRGCRSGWACLCWSHHLGSMGALRGGLWERQAPRRWRGGREDNHGLLCQAVNGNLGVLQGQAHPLRTPRGHICGCSPSFPGVGVMQKGQADEVAEWGEGVGREQRGWGTHAEAKHLDRSAQGPGLDLDGCHSLTQGARGLLGGPGSQEVARGGSQEPGGEPGRLGGGRAGLSLTRLQLDVAASFDLCDPAVVNGPRGLWNRQLGLRTSGPLQRWAETQSPATGSLQPSADESCSPGVRSYL